MTDKRITQAVRSEHEHIIGYIRNEIKYICEKLPKRAPASDGERAAADYMSGVLRDTCGCERVTVEEYEAHPGAFYGWLYITNTFYLIAIAFVFHAPLLTAVLIAIGYLIDNLEFVFYKEAVDGLFPKRKGKNVTAILEPAGEIKQRVFLNGHTDAAWEWPVNYYFGGIAFEAMALIPTIGAHYYFVLAVVSMIRGAGGLMPWWIGGLIFVPFTIAIFFLRNPKRVVDGANDNLSACYMGIALLKLMRENGIRPEHTELGVLLTGSEESGLRGAKAWAKKHKHDYRDVPTWIISMDTIHDPGHFGVNYKDLNGTVRSDEEIADRFIRAAKNVSVPICKTMVPLMGGATDSAAFTREGFRSIGVTALNHKLEKYYHTRLDSWDNLNDEGLFNCLLTCAEFVELIDRECCE